jgi:signal transduction histidine kinase
MAENVSAFMHEIKNPLNNVYMLVQSIEKEEDVESIKQSMALIKQSIQQIKAIEGDFNEYRKTGKTSIRPGTINIGGMLSSLVEEYRPMANSYNVKLNVVYKVGRIYTDGDKLRQVLSNMLSNAIKYNKNGGTVYVTYNKTPTTTNIIVKDTGIGMSEEELKCIGTPFYRSKKVDAPGTGLGVSLIKKITGMMGWGLDISSKEGMGTEITLTVPIG